jgi:hypothetical protein
MPPTVVHRQHRAWNGAAPPRPRPLRVTGLLPARPATAASSVLRQPSSSTVLTRLSKRTTRASTSLRAPTSSMIGWRSRCLRKEGPAGAAANAAAGVAMGPSSDHRPDLHHENRPRTLPNAAMQGTSHRMEQRKRKGLHQNSFPRCLTTWTQYLPRHRVQLLPRGRTASSRATSTPGAESAGRATPEGVQAARPQRLRQRPLQHHQRPTRSATRSLRQRRSLTRSRVPCLLPYSNYHQAGTAVSSDAGGAHLPRCGKASASRPSAGPEATPRNVRGRSS